VRNAPLHIIHLEQDDPKKCTARKLEKFGHAILHRDIRKSPKRGFLLDPKAGILLGPDDRSSIERGASIVALDCSWKQIDSSLKYIEQNTRLEGRTLPCVLAANPVSWGKPGRLSTSEALALSLVLLDRWDQAREIMKPFRFAKSFFELNAEPLEAYSKANNNSELAELQWEFFDRPESSDL
jgi:pre-rRNA-processing protein TSR3